MNIIDDLMEDMDYAAKEHEHNLSEGIKLVNDYKWNLSSFKRFVMQFLLTENNEDQWTFDYESYALTMYREGRHGLALHPGTWAREYYQERWDRNKYYKWIRNLDNGIHTDKIIFDTRNPTEDDTSASTLPLADVIGNKTYAKQIKTTVEYLDDVREMFNKFSHFTVRNGKAKYHMISIANSSVGIYYAIRFAEHEPIIEAKRALEPLTEIICWGE